LRTDEDEANKVLKEEGGELKKIGGATEKPTEGGERGGE
jgi:hypothetical protein